MKRTFTFCEHCDDARRRGEIKEVFETSSDFEYCAAGHFFQSSRSEYDGRPGRAIRTLKVERNETKDIIAVDRTQISNGGDYDFFAFTVID